jgi:hypothetical protein
MNRKVLCGLVLLLAASPAMAAAQTAVGLRAGVRWADLDSPQDTEAVRTLVAGGYFALGVSERLALQLEAVYGERGAANVRIGDGVLDAGADPVQLTMRYVDVPLLLRAGFPGERFLPSFFVGPYAGFLLACEIGDDDGRHDCDAEDQPARFDRRSTDFGILVGGALDAAIGTSTVFLDVRYALGLNTIASGANALDARHRGLEVTAGFAFPLGR